MSNIGGLLVNKQQGSDNGYIPLPKPNFHPEKAGEAHKSQHIDELKLQYIQKFITLCKDNSIKLAFMVSPAYTIADVDLYDTLKDIAKRNDVPFFDYHTSGLFLDYPEYFKDGGHLWHKGAELYSSIFAQDLKKYLRAHQSQQ